MDLTGTIRTRLTVLFIRIVSYTEVILLNWCQSVVKKEFLSFKIFIENTTVSIEGLWVECYVSIMCISYVRKIEEETVSKSNDNQRMRGLYKPNKGNNELMT